MVVFMSVNQTIEYIDRRYTSSINQIYLAKGWKVVSVHPVSTHTEHTSEYGAYVVLEKEELDSFDEYPLD